MTGEHPNDEDLSAYLDGELSEAASVVAAPGETLPVHLTACAACRRRLEALGRARDLVRLPVSPVPSSVKEAAVAAAITEGLAVGNGRQPAPTAVPRRGPQWTRSPRVVAAAAVALVAVTVGAVLELSHGRAGTATSATAAHAPSCPATPGANREPAAIAPTGVTDLGSVGSVHALQSRLAPLLESEKDSAAATGAPLSAGTQSASSLSTSDGFGVAGSVPTDLATCVAKAKRATGTADMLALVATLTYGRTPALVVVLQVTGTTSTPKPAPLAVVMARSDCRILARTSL